MGVVPFLLFFLSGTQALESLLLQLRHVLINRRDLFVREPQALWNRCSAVTAMSQPTVIKQSLAAWALIVHDMSASLRLQAEKRGVFRHGELELQIAGAVDRGRRS